MRLVLSCSVQSRARLFPRLATCIYQLFPSLFKFTIDSTHHNHHPPRTTIPTCTPFSVFHSPRESNLLLVAEKYQPDFYIPTSQLRIANHAPPQPFTASSSAWSPPSPTLSILALGGKKVKRIRLDDLALFIFAPSHVDGSHPITS